MGRLKLRGLYIKAPAIVASLGADASSALDRAVAEGADIVEVRLDLIREDPLEVLKEVRKRTDLPILATCRLAAEGGRFRGPEDSRIDLLVKAAGFADLVDVELRSPYRDGLIGQVSVPVVVSYHDFVGMADVESMLEQAFLAGADLAKVAVTPSFLSDNLYLLSLLLLARRPTCIVAMGELGRHMRAVAPLYGSALTYGYVTDQTAPGQMSVSDLALAFRILGVR